MKMRGRRWRWCDEDRHAARLACQSLTNLLQIQPTNTTLTSFLSSTVCNPVVPVLLTIRFCAIDPPTSSTGSRDVCSNLIRKEIPFHFSSNYDSITTPSTHLIPLLQLPRRRMAYAMTRHSSRRGHRRMARTLDDGIAATPAGTPRPHKPTRRQPSPIHERNFKLPAANSDHRYQAAYRTFFHQ